MQGDYVTCVRTHRDHIMPYIILVYQRVGVEKESLRVNPKKVLVDASLSKMNACTYLCVKLTQAE